jgi:ABC-type Zn uptake system ZnuABC Zn-binding protein ZnuA
MPLTRCPMFTRRNVLSAVAVVALGSAVWLIGCSEAKDPWDGKPTPHVLVTVPSLYSFAKSVAGEHGEVKCLCTETGPHHYKETANDNRALRDATLFFTVGLGLDDKFADRMVKAVSKDSGRVELGEELPDKMKLKAREEHDEKDAKGDEHHHGDIDPHVWLGTPQAVAMVETIRDKLKEADKAHAQDYDKNAEAYVAELKKLHDDGVKMLAGKKDRRIISFHDSLEYFAKEFGIEIVDVIEMPGKEPITKDLSRLVDRCLKEDVRIIAVEPQYPEVSATAIKNALKEKGKTVVLVEIDPLETAEPDKLSAGLYVETMRKNLKNLADQLP